MKIIYYIFIVLFFTVCTSSPKNETEVLEENQTVVQSKTEEQPELMPPNVNKPVIHSDSLVAIKFINSYVDNLNRMKDAVEISVWVDSSQLVTRDFKKGLHEILRKAYQNEPEYGLGFDPILDAPDYPDEGFELVSYDRHSGYATIKGKDWEDFIVNLKIVEINGQLLVDGCGVINIPSDMRAER